MTNEQVKLKSIVDKAICKFNQNEKYLLNKNLSERCICSKFAVYLEREIKLSNYPNYEVDVEYNRGVDGDERSPKRLNDKNIDLIVHTRGYDEIHGYDNLICIEMKKFNNKRGTKGIEDDEERLRGMTNYGYGFNYKIGFMIIADIKNNKLFDSNTFLLN